MGKAGAIEAIIKAIGAHTNNENVCEKGCRALCNATSNGNIIYKNEINKIK